LINGKKSSLIKLIIVMNIFIMLVLFK